MNTIEELQCRCRCLACQDGECEDCDVQDCAEPTCRCRIPQMVASA